MAAKKKFRVYGKMVASKCLGTFEATSRKKAVEAALGSEQNYVNLCHQCSHEIDLNDIVFEEAFAEEEPSQ